MGQLEAAARGGTVVMGTQARGPGGNRAVGSARVLILRSGAAAEALMQTHVQFDQVTAMDLLAALA